MVDICTVKTTFSINILSIHGLTTPTTDHTFLLVAVLASPRIQSIYLSRIQVIIPVYSSNIAPLGTAFLIGCCLPITLLCILLLPPPFVFRVRVIVWVG